MNRTAVIPLVLALLYVALVTGCLPSPPDTQDPTEGQPGPTTQFHVRLMGSSRFSCGRLSSLRLYAFQEEDVRPLAGVLFAGDLVLPRGGAIHLFTGKTREDGTTESRFLFPEVRQAKGTLVIHARYGKAKRVFSYPVAIRTNPWKLQLFTAPHSVNAEDTLAIGGSIINALTLKPVSARELLITLADPANRVILERTLKTSPEGSFSLDFRLSPGAPSGQYRVTARSENISASDSFSVGSSSAPDTLAVSTDRRIYSPGDTARIRLSAGATSGLPAEGISARIRVVSDPSRQTGAVFEGKTDRNGLYEIQYRLPETLFESRRSELELLTLTVVGELRNSAAVIASSSAELSIQRSPFIVALVPERPSLRKGIPNRLRLISWYPEGKPAPCDAIVQLGRDRIVLSTDSTGFAETEYTPREEKELGCKIMAKDRRGSRTFRNTVIPVAESAESLLVRTTETARTGQQAELTIHSTRPSGTVFLDFIKDGELIATQSAELSRNRAVTGFKYIRELMGLCTIHAYLLSGDGSRIADTCHLYTWPAQRLSINLALQRQAHRPFDDAEAVFTIWSKDAKPAQSSIDVELLRELPGEGAPLFPAGPLISALVPDELLDTLPGLAGLSGRQILLARMRLPNNAWYQRLATAILSQFSHEPSYELSTDTYAPRVRTILKALGDIQPLLQEYRVRYGHFPASMKDLVRRKMLSRESSLDPWNRSYLITSPRAASFTPAPPFGIFTKGSAGRPDGRSASPDLLCKGADGVVGTADDVSLADMAARRTSEKEQRQPAPLPVIRLPEKYVEVFRYPAIRTDRGGRAILPIRRRDRLASLRINSFAWTAEGDSGDDYRLLELPENCSMEATVPPRLTVGDRFTVPIVLKNLLPGSQEIVVRLNAQPPSRIAFRESSKRLDLKEAEQGVLSFSLEARAAGPCKIDVIVEGRKRNWTQGYDVSVFAQGTREEIVPPYGRADSVEGLLSLLGGLPSGALDDMLFRGAAATIILERGRLRDTAQAREMLDTIYHRLLLEDGGAPKLLLCPERGRPSAVLTAMALWEVCRMARWRPVDGRLIARLQRGLESLQSAQGAWADPFLEGLHAPPANQGGSGATVLVTFFLEQAGLARPALQGGAARLGGALTPAEREKLLAALFPQGTRRAGSAKKADGAVLPYPMLTADGMYTLKMAADLCSAMKGGEPEAAAPSPWEPVVRAIPSAGRGLLGLELSPPSVSVGERLLVTFKAAGAAPPNATGAGLLFRTPPGCSVELVELDEMRENGTISAYRPAGQDVILFFPARRSSLSFHLKAVHAAEVHVLPAELFHMNDARTRYYSGAQRLIIKE